MTPNQESMKKYGHDVIFMGQERDFLHHTPAPGGRTGLIKYIQEQEIDLKLVSYNKKGSGKIGGSEWNMACNAAKIVLGHCGWANTACSTAQRDYRVIASGGFLLTEYIQEMELQFEVGVEIATYTTNENCVEKIRYYLEHEEERKTIQEAGYASRSKHSITDRFRDLVQILERVKAEITNT